VRSGLLAAVLSKRRPVIWPALLNEVEATSVSPVSEVRLFGLPAVV
jgi:hypothetical protein